MGLTLLLSFISVTRVAPKWHNVSLRYLVTVSAALNQKERDERTATEAAHLLLEVKLSRDLLRNPTWLPTSAHQAQAAPGKGPQGEGGRCGVTLLSEMDCTGVVVTQAPATSGLL